MKKLRFLLAPVLAFGLIAFAGCGIPAGNAAPQGENGTPQGEEKIPQDPPVSPLAILDTVDVSAAFGDRAEEGWSFSLQAAGEWNASYGFSLLSEISDEEKVNVEFGCGAGLSDLLGLRSAEDSVDVDLFGGGEANFTLYYRGPKSDSESVSKNLTAGFRHDGDLIWYAEEGEPETSTSLAALKEQIQSAAGMMTFERMQTAATLIPEELEKGVSLRVAVEKLICLGFAVQIDDTDGIAITLQADKGFYTDLLNDLLEELIPAKWLKYIPRADLRYEKTVFNLRLAFDENGLFRAYSMESDVSLTTALEVRGLFGSESTVKAAGAFSLLASDVIVPGSDASPESPVAP